ncbi:MAG: glycerophosphodiester phosphodiesterase family protein [Actinomycetota bacterium]|nr:glycerophosphodiester phosphodiesterase family protein [Actinomycetota bacterium]
MKARAGASNPWTCRKVLCFAHQGGAHDAPASTVMAMHRAVLSGAHALELDVHATSDGVIVCSHDPVVDTTTDGTGAIASMTYAEVGLLDAAWWFVPGRGAVTGLPDSSYPLRGARRSEPGLALASLRQVLEQFPSTLLNLDIKQTSPVVEPYEALVAEELARAGRTEGVIVGSFSEQALTAFHEVAPHVDLAATPAAVARLLQSLLELGDGGNPSDESSGTGCVPSADNLPYVALQVPASMAGVEIVTPQLMAASERLEVAVHVWTVNDMAEAGRLVRLGVHGVMSDAPAAVSAYLRDRGASWAAG